jgi:AraC-like DNA-binding protein
MKAGASFNRLVAVSEMIDSEMKLDNPDFSVVRQLLISLFTMIESDRKKLTQNADPVQISQNVTFKNFLRILEENFRRPAGVEFYAQKLFMTSRNLNIVCNNIMQQSVSEIIENRKLTEAKNLLITTGKTVSEISYELGYNEKSYFSNVFRKKTGQTPGEFRREMRKLMA